MNKFNMLAVPFALIMWVNIYLLFLAYGQDAYDEIQIRRLQYAVNYCVDAAVDELTLNTADLGMDYSDYERINTDPQVAMDTFLRLYCLNYNMALTEENYTLIKTEYLQMLTVAAYDGYYIATPQQINDSGAYDAIFTIKQPYLYKRDTNLYALNLGLADAKLFDGSSIQKVDPPLTQQEQLLIINENVSDDLMVTIFEQKEGAVHSTFFIPSAMTNIVETNPIDRVTVMAYISNVDVGYGEVLEVFGIGGARVTHAQYVGCYEKDGLLSYTYVERIPEGVDLIATYESPLIAAENGYYFDVSTMSK